MATVITAEDIATMGAVDLDEVLETVPGLHVSRDPIAYAPIYVFRGVYSQNNPQVLVLQNGVPMTTAFLSNKGGVWGGYPLDHIARIEIIRGPGSALYGADAYAGVINIVTKSAEDNPGTQLGARRGSFNTWDTWVQHGGRLGPVDVAAYLRVGHTDGLKETITADAQTGTDQFFGTNASLAPGPVNTGRDAVDANLDFGYDKWRFRTGYKLRDDVETGAGVASALDPVGRAKSERVTADLSWTDTQFAPDWSLGFLGSYLHYTDLIPTTLQLFPPGTSFPTGTFPEGMLGSPNKWERQYRLSTFATYTGFADHRLRFGLGHDDIDLYKTSEQKNFTFTPGGLPIPIGSVQDFSTAPFMFPQRRTINYYYVQDEWQFARDWALTAGLRHDEYSDFGGTTNPRLALVWDAAYNVTAKLLYGEAFRAPSFVEQHSINNPVQRGNPDLRPETIKTVEAAFSWQARPDTQVNLSLFRYNMKDIIRLVPNATPGTGSTFDNTGDQSGSGMEIETVWDVSRTLRLSGNYAYQRSIDESTDQDAGNAPHDHVYARADWRLASGWLFSSQINWVADRKRAAGDTRPDVPDYKTVDLTLQRQARGNQWLFMFSVRNVFDEDAREPSPGPAPGQAPAIPNDLPLAGRSYLLQARYALN